MMQYAVTYITFESFKDFSSGQNYSEASKKIAAKSPQEAADAVADEDEFAVIQGVYTIH